MNGSSMMREAAALRHTFHVKRRLQLEFLADLSKLLREHGVRADDDLLSNLILAVPDELMNGDRSALMKSQNGSRKYTKKGSKKSKKGRGLPPQTALPPQTILPPQTPGKTLPPQTPARKRRRKTTTLPPQTPGKPVALPPQTPARKKRKAANGSKKKAR